MLAVDVKRCSRRVSWSEDKDGWLCKKKNEGSWLGRSGRAYDDTRYRRRHGWDAEVAAFHCRKTHRSYYYYYYYLQISSRNTFQSKSKAHTTENCDLGVNRLRWLFLQSWFISANIALRHSNSYIHSASSGDVKPVIIQNFSSLVY